MKNIKLLKISNVLTTLAVFIVNTLANALPLNGIGTGELSDSYPNLFVPSGLTFSIWGLIYLLQTLLIIYQYKLENTDPFFEKTSWIYVVSNLANFGWIFAWHWEVLWLSLTFMLILLGSLIAIYLRLGIGKEKTTKPEGIKGIALYTTFSFYLGWITVATIANIVALLVDANWSAWGISESAWAIIMIIVATIVGIVILYTRKDAAYTSVLIWAFIGIALKRLDSSISVNPEVGYIAIAGAVLLGAFAILQKLKK